MKITITKEEGLEIIRTWAIRTLIGEDTGLVIKDVRLPSSYSTEYEIDVEPKADKKGEKDEDRSDDSKS